MRAVRLMLVAVCVMPLTAAPGPVTAQAAQTPKSAISDTVVIATSALGASAGATSVQMARETTSGAEVVLIARDDSFADALASGTLQDDGPLLLVPTAGPVPAEVRSTIADLGASRAVILGGEAAVAPQVVAELQAAGLTVERRAGPSRVETAVAVARDRADARTAILARAFAAAGASPSQGFADALAAGGLAAAEGLPVLLTATDALSAPTRAHLNSSQIEHVLIVGGTAAIGPAVEEELRSLGLTTERLAGADRFGTAIAVAKRRGASSAADVARFVLLDGTAEDAWVAGFTAAGHSAALAAPIVLGAPGLLPPATRDWVVDSSLSSLGDQTDPGVRITCAIDRHACEEARTALGLQARAQITYDPVSGALPAGGTVTIVIEGDAEDVRADGSCLAAPVVLGAAGGVVERASGEGPCTLILDLVLPGGLTQREEVEYQAVPAGPRLLAGGLCGGYRDPALSADGTSVAFLVDPATGCGEVASSPAMAFLAVADGTPTVLPLPEGRAPRPFADRVIISPDGRLALANLEIPGDATTTAPWVFDRVTGQVRELSATNPALVDSDTMVIGGPQAWRPDGSLLGRFCGSTGCFSAIDPLDGTLSDPTNACLAWWAQDPQAVLCDYGTLTAGPDAVLFEGAFTDGQRAEVRYDTETGATSSVRTPCDHSTNEAGWGVNATGLVVYRACPTGFAGTGEMSLVISSFQTGESRVVATHTEPDARQSLHAGRVDPEGRWVPLRYAIGDGTVGRGVLHDLSDGAHVELGTVRGVPQLHVPGAIIIVASDAGLERRPVELGQPQP